MQKCRSNSVTFQGLMGLLSADRFALSSLGSLEQLVAVRDRSPEGMIRRRLEYSRFELDDTWRAL